MAAEPLREFGALTARRGADNTVDGHAPRVFTIFCHGTGGHRDGKCRELISLFGGGYWWNGSNASRPTNVFKHANYFYREGTAPNFHNDFYETHYQQDFLILDGVGTSDMWKTRRGPAQIGLAGKHNPMPGDFKGDYLSKPLKGSWPGRFKSSLRSKFGTSEETVVARRVSEMKVKVGKTIGNRGDIYGDGWNDNVCHALFVLKQLLSKARGGKNVFPNVINLIGWSRGAVTTLKLAYWIQKYFKDFEDFCGPRDYDQSYVKDVGHMYLKCDLTRNQRDQIPAGLEVNIFAIDPVPGRFGKIGSWGKSDAAEEIFPPRERDYQNLPSVVNHCIITLALDEHRGGFVAIDADKLKVLPGEPGKSEAAKVVWLPFPGIHRTQLRRTPRDPIGDWEEVRDVRDLLTAVPRIVFDLAWQFLTFHGTRFQKPYGRKRTLEETVERYSDIWVNRAAYHKARNTGFAQRVQGWFKNRKFTGYKPGKFFKAGVSEDNLFTKKLGVYTMCPGLFINEHHRWCFEHAYPDLYDWAALAVPIDARTWEAAIRPIGKSSSLWGFVRLLANDKKYRSERGYLGHAPTGHGHVEPPRFTGWFDRMTRTLDGNTFLEYVDPALARRREDAEPEPGPV